MKHPGASTRTRNDSDAKRLYRCQRRARRPCSASATPPCPNDAGADGAASVSAPIADVICLASFSLEIMSIFAQMFSPPE